jgi:hypothetical protein
MLHKIQIDSPSRVFERRSKLANDLLEPLRVNSLHLARYSQKHSWSLKCGFPFSSNKISGNQILYNVLTYIIDFQGNFA